MNQQHPYEPIRNFSPVSWERCAQLAETKRAKQPVDKPIVVRRLSIPLGEYGSAGELSFDVIADPAGSGNLLTVTVPVADSFVLSPSSRRKLRDLLDNLD
ncbi:hypothetical protein [Bifidobacterium sp. SO1]|uniref:hypothetical protein n=1 Tax=Bifidobacterium sp. SO1 TaxID=2809029 RepID=UPI001BDD4FE6|nr:hypothetical protein [Bifidobacterium sp. SO1]MBT1162213.1 hypothetical protein [Bifidobacterium sp. SO1]